MTYEDFKKSLNTFFKPYGFRRHSTHFHCEASDGVMVVFGVYKSVYDTDLCYMEYGYAFKEICEQWPYPRVNYLHLNCGRIHLPNRNNIYLSAIDDEEFKQFCELLESLVKPALEVARLGKEGIKQAYFIEKKYDYFYVTGPNALKLFGLTREEVMPHSVFSDRSLEPPKKTRKKTEK